MEVKPKRNWKKNEKKKEKGEMEEEKTRKIGRKGSCYARPLELAPGGQTSGKGKKGGEEKETEKEKKIRERLSLGVSRHRSRAQ